MRSPVTAMLWELLRLSRIELPIRLGAICFFAILIGMLTHGLGEWEKQLVFGIAVAMFMIPAPFSQAWLSELDSKSEGFSFRLGYVRPVSTTILVLVPLLFIMATSVANYLIPALFASYLWGKPIPLLGPSLIVALIVQASVGVVWSMTHRWSKLVGILFLAAFIVGLIAFFAARQQGTEPILLSISKPSYFELHWQQYGIVLVWTLVTLFLTIAAVDRQRHGDEWPWDTPLRLLREKASTGRATQTSMRPFRSELSAQFWYEWHRISFRVLMSGLMTSVFLLVFLTLCNLLYPGRGPNTVTWMIVLAISPVCFQIIAAEGAVGLKHVHGTTRLSLFDATRSMASDQVILVKLIVIAGSSLTAWLILAVGAYLHLVILGQGDDWRANSVVSASLVDWLTKLSAHLSAGGWFICICNLLFLFVSSSSSLLALGLWLPLYLWRIVGLGFIVLMHAAVLVVAIRYGWPIQSALTAYGYFLSGLIFIVSLACIRYSLQRGGVGRRYLAAFGSFSLFQLAMTIWLLAEVGNPSLLSIPTVGVAMGFAMQWFPLAAIAAAPLAYATHRAS